jgi:hypothetical protein
VCTSAGTKKHFNEQQQDIPAAKMIERILFTKKIGKSKLNASRSDFH